MPASSPASMVPPGSIALADPAGEGAVPAIAADTLFEAAIYDLTAADPAAVSRWEAGTARAALDRSGRLYREIALVRPGDDRLRMTHLLLCAVGGPQYAAAATACADLVSFPCIARTTLRPTTGAFFGLLGSGRQQPGRAATLSMELIDVPPAFADAYQEVMRCACGPAAERAIAAGLIGSFWALERCDASTPTTEGSLPPWNQLHLFAIDPARFDAFLEQFASDLRVLGFDFAELFGYLDTYRSVRHWAFVDPVE